MAEYIDRATTIETIKRTKWASIETKEKEKQNLFADEIAFNIYKDVPVADVIEVPNNATNGDMIKAMFNDFESALLLQVISKEWWNAPYKKESEEWEE